MKVMITALELTDGGGVDRPPLNTGEWIPHSFSLYSIRGGTANSILLPTGHQAA